MIIGKKLRSFLLAILVIVTVLNASELKSDYYQYSCPNVLEISRAITEQFVTNDPTLAPGLLRMDFHDCFVRGCDASILLDPTPYNNETEKDTVPNSTIRGFEVVDAIKEELEHQCPGVVSCADVLRLASRDAIALINGPYWDVTFGRKDGRISLGSEALVNIPSPFSNISTLEENFAAVGLSSKDLAVLSGAHTIGIFHCFVIQKRLYNFTGNGDGTDPTLDSSYAEYLKFECPKRIGDLETIAPMDPISPTVFDDNYYTLVSEHKGVFQSDAALLDDSGTNAYVQFQVMTQGVTFASDFAESMSKMIEIGVLTDYEGEIRKTCRAANSY